jgi:hypothetical protein
MTARIMIRAVMPNLFRHLPILEGMPKQVRHDGFNHDSDTGLLLHRSLLTSLVQWTERLN